MKQTAVDWLFEQLWETPKDKLNWYAILQQAKEIEKQQIIDAYDNGKYITSGKEFGGEQYYTETFKNK